MKDETKAKLEALVAAGVAEDIDSAMEFCVLRTCNDMQAEGKESPEEIAEIRRRVKAMRRGEERVSISSREEFRTEVLAASASIAQEEVASSEWPTSL